MICDGSVALDRSTKKFDSANKNGNKDGKISLKSSSVNYNIAIGKSPSFLLLMAEILHQLIGNFSLVLYIPGGDRRISEPSTVVNTINQWLFLFPVKGGRDYITSQKARTISGI